MLVDSRIAPPDDAGEGATACLDRKAGSSMDYVAQFMREQSRTLVD